MPWKSGASEAVGWSCAFRFSKTLTTSSVTAEEAPRERSRESCQTVTDLDDSTDLKLSRGWGSMCGNQVVDVECGLIGRAPVAR
jgi:hypothetical protein